MRYDKRRLPALFFFIIYLAIGLALAGRYGCGIDARTERKSSLITYRYINETLFDRLPSPGLKELEELSEYKDRWYGMAMQIPMVMVEDVFDFRLSEHDVFVMRQYFTFLYCYAGYLCFYFMLRRIFPSNVWIPLIGTACIALYPRFFALQFADVKNPVFNALVMAACYCMVLAVEKKRIGYDVLFGCVAALATNQRIMGVLFPCTLAGYFIISDLTAFFLKKGCQDETKRYRVLKYPAVIISYFAFWTFITPLAWKRPLHIFIETFKAFSDFYGWNRHMVFMGRLITRAEMPWYYLPVWMGITIPVFIWVLFLAGHVRFVTDIIRSKDRLMTVLGDQKWLTCQLFLFWAIFFNIVLRHGAIYVGWHHVYFIYVPMVAAAMYGLEYLTGVIDRRMVYAAVGVYFVLQCAWLLRHHPYQNVYFNVIGMHYGDQFDRDEERLASLQMTRWILSREEGPVSVSSKDGVLKPDPLLTDQERERILEEEPAMYIIECYRNVIGSDVQYEGYEEVRTIWMGGFKIGSVYRRL